MTEFPLEDPGMFDYIFDTLYITIIDLSCVYIRFRLWSNSAGVCGGSFVLLFMNEEHFLCGEYKMFTLAESRHVLVLAP